MRKETVRRRRTRAAEVVGRLEAQMPEAKIALRFQSPLELLVSVVLSAQCTDLRVNQVTPALFARYPDVRALAQAKPEELEPLIRSCGLFRNKARNLVALAQALLERHGGEVPKRREELEALPGVGPKSAGVVCIHLGGDRSFPVDTHVGRLARRLGLSAEQDPSQVEEDLRGLLPPERWGRAHQLLVWHGRRTCTARAPRCEACAVRKLCPRLGVGSPGPRPPARVERIPADRPRARP
ncbi:MAG: endonuclease III [Myxococcales bacterium]|nr:endonuclease III [Myxococcales bacterium]